MRSPYLIPAFISIFFTVLSFHVAAQNRAVIRGKVLDSLNRQPMEFATVALLLKKDSSLLSYTLTDKNGEFTLRNIKTENPLRLLISYAGYKAYRRSINFSKGLTVDLRSILLQSRDLEEVVITAERVPIMVKKDTIEFSPEAFKTRPNAAVEELLKKLPGVQVDNDGSITVQGRPVSKVLIDGKQFFGDDPKVATRNLDAELISKVQVYDDRENDPDHLIEASKVNKIINLRLKKAIKRSIFGKVYAGGGSEKRYESGGLINMFRDTLQISLIGVANNLDKTGFSSQDLYSMGGFDRSGGNAIYDGTISLGGDGYNGVQKVGSGGFNLNTDYGKKLKMNLLYFFSHSQTDYKSVIASSQVVGDTTLFSVGSSVNQQISNKHSLGGLINWNPDTLTQLRYEPKFNYTKNNSGYLSDGTTANNFVPQLSKNRGEANADGSQTEFQHSFLFNRRLRKKKASFNVSHNIRINPGSDKTFSKSELLSYVSTLPSDTLNRLSDNSSKNVSANLDLSFRYPFGKKLTADITAAGNYIKSGQARFIFDRDPENGLYTIILADQSSDMNRDTWEEKIKPGITYDFTKNFSIVAGLGMVWQRNMNRFNRSDVKDFRQRYFYLLPSGRISFHSFSLSYDAYVNQPSINNLQPVTIVYSPLYSFSGNPDLKPTRNHNISLNYYKYNWQKQVNFYFYGNATIEENSILQRKTQNGSGAQTTMPVNRNGQHRIYGGGSFSKNFKKQGNLQTGIRSNFNLSYNHQFFIVNQDEGFQNDYSFNISAGGNVNWKDKVEINPEYSISPRFTRYKDVDYKNLTYVYHNLNTTFTFRWPKHIYWQGNYAYSYNPLVSQGFQKDKHLLNAAVALQLFKKETGELKLSCYDILDQNISNYRYVSENSVYDVQSEILRRYFLLTFLFKFNKIQNK